MGAHLPAADRLGPAQPRVLVHRDYMPRNLMISEPNPGVLDFQDAVLGPVSYDITSLFKDAFLSWPEPQVQAWLEDYWGRARAAGVALPESFEEFLRASDLMGVQRHLKVIGIFARICHRDGKPVISPMCRVSSPISRPCWRGGRTGRVAAADRRAAKGAAGMKAMILAAGKGERLRP